MSKGFVICFVKGGYTNEYINDLLRDLLEVHDQVLRRHCVTKLAISYGTSSPISTHENFGSAGLGWRTGIPPDNQQAWDSSPNIYQ
jgi:hypothetical protein